MFSKQPQAAPGNNDTFLVLVVVILIGIIIFFALPIIFSTFIGGYFLYWAWFSKDERKISRSVVIFISYGLFLSSIWYVIISKFPKEILNFVKLFTNETRTTESVVQSIILPYLVVFPLMASVALAYFFYKKWQPTEPLYQHVRSAILYLVKPTSWGVSVFNFIPKRGFLTYLVSFYLAAFAVLIVPSLIAGAVSMGVKLPVLGRLLGTIYLLLGLYSVFSKSKKVSAFEASINGVFGKSEGIQIGSIVKPVRRNLILPWKDINHHIHILGQPGSGKSVLLRNFYSHQIQKGAGLMLIDLKADLDVKSEIQGLVQSVNRESDLVVIDLSNPDKSMGYNPLLRGESTELKDKIMSSMDWSEPYYKKMAERFLLIILNGLVAVRDSLNLTPTLQDVYECLTYPESLEELAEKLSENYTRQKIDLRELAKDLKDKKVFADLVSIRTDIEVMLKSNFGQILTRPDGIDLYKAMLEKKIIFVELDGQTYRETAVRLGRMLISDLRSASGAVVSNTSKEERPQFTVIIDEFADIISNEEMGQGFVSLLNRCRGSGIGVIIAHQSLGDFKDERTRTQVLDSTETTFSFVQKDPESCETLAKIIGTQEAISVTEQTDQFLFLSSKTGRGTQKLTQEYIFHPNEFKSLNVGEAIYIAKRPHRFGKVQVKNIEVPLLQKKLEDQSWRDRDPKLQGTMLNLYGGRLHKRNLNAIADSSAFDRRIAAAVTEADI